MGCGRCVVEGVGGWESSVSVGEVRVSASRLMFPHCVQAKVAQKKVTEKKAKPQVKPTEEEEEESSEQDDDEEGEEEEGSSGSSSDEEDQEAVVGLKRKIGDSQNTVAKKSKVTEEQSESDGSYMLVTC